MIFLFLLGWGDSGSFYEENSTFGCESIDSKATFSEKY